MQIRGLAFLVCLGVWAPLVGRATAATVILVRHAEKAQIPGEKDVPLSPAGEARAGRLSAILSDTTLAAIYVTDLKRTQQTAAPVAGRQKLVPLVRSRTDAAAYVAALAAELKARPESETVLVVSHSDTVPAILAALGKVAPVTLEETDYDSVFVVRLSATAAPSVLRLSYPTP